MLYLAGCPVDENYGRWLIQQLRDRADDLHATTAANAIEKALDHRMRAISLTPEERSAILAVLDDPPHELAELRGQLLHDRP